MFYNPNISIFFISENTYTENYPLGAFIENHIKKDCKVLRHFITEFLEIPLDVLKANIGSFSVTDWINEFPTDFDVLILEESHEIKERPFTQSFLADILTAFSKNGKKIIIIVDENSLNLNLGTFKNHLYSKLGKDKIFETDFQTIFSNPI